MRHPTRRCLLLLLFAIGAAGGACSDTAGTDDGSVQDGAVRDATLWDTVAPDAPRWDDSLQIGTWDGRFTRLAALDNAFTLVAGPQGGYHIDIALAFDLQAFDSVSIALEAVDAGDQQTLSHPLQRMLDSTNVQKLSGLWVWSGERVIFMSTDPQEIVGRSIEIRARATRSGAVAEAVAAGTVSPL